MGWGKRHGTPDHDRTLLLSPVYDLAFLTRMFYLHNQKYTCPSISEEEERLLYTDEFWQRVQGLAFDSLREELSGYQGERPDMQSDYVFLQNHCRRLTQNLVIFLSVFVEVRYPYFGYHLLEFLFSLPAIARADRNLYWGVIQREIPRLASIPYDLDELLPTSRRFVRNAHDFGVRMKRRINRHIGPVFPEYTSLYADYENYLRNELRPWAEGILFDRRMIERGIFNQAFFTQPDGSPPIRHGAVDRRQNCPHHYL